MSSEVDMSQLPMFLALGLNNPLCFLIYIRATNNVEISESIQVDIDLSSLIEGDNGIITRKERVKALKQLEKAGFVEVLHSSNWKHRKLLVHPMQKVIDEREKARKERNRNAT